MPDRAPSLIDRLPHGEAFRFLSDITAITPGESATGAWHVQADDVRFAGHFPGRPVVPGVLITEALAQLAGIVAFASQADSSDASADGAPGMLVHVDVRFKKAVTPPATIVLEASLVRRLGTLAQFEVQATCDGALVARGSLAVAHGGGA